MEHKFFVLFLLGIMLSSCGIKKPLERPVQIASSEVLYEGKNISMHNSIYYHG
jgi:hypothetical protein